MILVTGASGFIGKYVVRELIGKEQKVCCLSRNVENYQYIGEELCIEGDLSDIGVFIDRLQSLEIDTLIHLAWEGIPDYSYEMSQRNLRYGLNVLQLCRELGIKKLVITGSCWEYDHPEGAVRTDYPLTFEKPFPAAKNALHMMAHAFCKENDIRLNWLRLFYVYGSGQREGSLIPYIIKCFEEGRQPELNGAYNENDFIHVEDVAKVIAKVVLSQEYPEIMNVGSGKATRVLDIVQECAKKSGFVLDEGVYPKKSGSSFWAYEGEEKDLFDGAPVKTVIERVGTDW